MAPTLEELMNPKAQELMARYEHARMGVNAGWTIASKLFEKKDQPDMQELATTARWIASEVTKDLNSAIVILEAKNGDSTATSEVSRPS